MVSVNKTSSTTGFSAAMRPSRLASSSTSPSTHSPTPVRRVRANSAAKKSFDASGRALRYCCKGLDVASFMACLTVAIVTFPCPILSFPSRLSPLSFVNGIRRPWDLRLLGVLRSGFCDVSDSAISTARRQMSRARRASPETAATFRLAN